MRMTSGPLIRYHRLIGLRRAAPAKRNVENADEDQHPDSYSVQVPKSHRAVISGHRIDRNGGVTG